MQSSGHETDHSQVTFYQHQMKGQSVKEGATNLPSSLLQERDPQIAPPNSHASRALAPYPEAGTVCVGPDEAEAIARNILASHSKSDYGGGVPGQEVLG